MALAITALLVPLLVFALENRVAHAAPGSTYDNGALLCLNDAGGCAPIEMADKRCLGAAPYHCPVHFSAFGAAVSSPAFGLTAWDMPPRRVACQLSSNIDTPPPRA